MSYYATLPGTACASELLSGIGRRLVMASMLASLFSYFNYDLQAAEKKETSCDRTIAVFKEEYMADANAFPQIRTELIKATALCREGKNDQAIAVIEQVREEVGLPMGYGK